MDNGALDIQLPEVPIIPKSTPEYLQELLMDKRQLQTVPGVFKHVEAVLDKEIARVREKLFHINSTGKNDENRLPDPTGEIITLHEKVFIPVKDNPTYNFVGRLLGPRGLTAKQLEQDLECKIMVRGKGSLRDAKKEEQNRGKPNWEHLTEELHVLLTVEDYQNRAEVKMKRAVESIRGFLEQGLKVPESEDRLKQMQLMELAMMNANDKQQQHQQQQQQAILAAAATHPLAALGAMGAPGAASPFGATGLSQAQFMNLQAAQAHQPVSAASPILLANQQLASQPASALFNTADPSALAAFLSANTGYPMVTQPQFIYSFPDHNILADYAASGLDATAGNALKLRATAANTVRMHPYQRSGL